MQGRSFAWGISPKALKVGFYSVSCLSVPREKPSAGNCRKNCQKTVGQSEGIEFAVELRLAGRLKKRKERRKLKTTFPSISPMVRPKWTLLNMKMCPDGPDIHSIRCRLLHYGLMACIINLPFPLHSIFLCEIIFCLSLPKIGQISDIVTWTCRNFIWEFCIYLQFPLLFDVYCHILLRNVK